MLTPLDSEDSHRQAAKDLEAQRPGWIVVWGVYSRRYWAFPLFNVPPRTILHATDPRDLATRMVHVELSAKISELPSGDG
jgi:hypothetical protein